MTTKKLALAISMILLGGLSSAAYAGTATPQRHHQVEHVSALPAPVSRAYDSMAVTEDRGPHYHGGPKVND
jgi:hypothetical protein